MNDTGYNVHVETLGDYEADLGAVEVAARCALSTAGAAAPCAFSIVLTSAEHMHELNLQYVGLDAPTDVLSFPAEDQPYEVDPGEPPYLGDVVIAYPVAKEQAREAGQTLLAELQMLAIHGTLHLLGFDHQTPEQQAEMWAYQSAAMDAVRQGGIGGSG